MATQASTIDLILSQLPPDGFATVKKMFGEYGLFVGGKMVAIIGEDQLFVKITNRGSAHVGTCDEVPPYPGAKPCFLIAPTRWTEPNFLTELFAATAQELPAPKKKK